MTPQSAQRAVARALHHEKVVSARPWLIKRPAIHYAMIAVCYKITDGDGCEVALHTWAIGLTVKAAVKAWRTANPNVVDDDFEYTVVTEPKEREPYQPHGERVEPLDHFLAAS